MLLLQHKPQYIVVNVVLLYNTFTQNQAFTSDIIHSLIIQFKCNRVKSASVKTRVLLRTEFRQEEELVTKRVRHGSYKQSLEVIC